ncbi:cytochrome C oxidase subunit II [Paenibacillus sambharensis]|uniref:Cytochrome aa3 subunit 2 n=1 Tax=Paenibacillus sambharensis TaxID=1803190 RepID=A0A2W1LTK8_9BACL|nr:cytochrome c oxidase subunit II [Paenibacillus sambharensis]PZD95121.1 cytochrome C oxidase subunit II [Paenibacillus sambharensis]
MHIHKLEKIWLAIGIAMLALFLTVLGISTFAFGMAPPGGHHAIDPEKAQETAPFNSLGLKKLGDNSYEAVMLAFAFGYEPQTIEVPVGAKVKFTLTSTDVVHGFAIPRTNVNVMVIPGEVSHVTHTFDEPGEYLILCNEYCGIGHEIMQAKIVVKG